MGVIIGAGDHRVARGGGTLSVMGLGSCIAIILYDDGTQVGGLAHILLPDPSLSTTPERRMKFASTAVPDLLEEMVGMGALRARVKARLVGGASMFGELLSSDQENIGDRNIAAARIALRSGGIKIVGEDVGGDFGRTVRFEVDNGQVWVRSPRRDEDVCV